MRFRNSRKQKQWKKKDLVLQIFFLIYVAFESHKNTLIYDL